MMVFSWFRDYVSAWDRRRKLTVLQGALVDQCLKVHGKTARAISEISLERKLMPKEQAIGLDTMEQVGLDWDLCDIK